MFDRENVVGLLLLAVCGAGAVILAVAIATGTRLRWTGPTWLAVVLGIGFFGALFYALFANRRNSSDGSPAWPDPRSGQRGGWRRWFRRGSDRGR
ncbi:MAG TPA: hypothetical protein VGR16_11485 [Thermomicrobiales bacterium]|nr:hypothetical protein [Thermomicrobiales bacterium]